MKVDVQKWMSKTNFVTKMLQSGCPKIGISVNRPSPIEFEMDFPIRELDFTLYSTITFTWDFIPKLKKGEPYNHCIVHPQKKNNLIFYNFKINNTHL